MSKYEFLSKLREALAAELSSQIVESHIQYYDQYITGAVMEGRTEQEVMDELGDPWMIARTIIDTSSEERREEFIYDASDSGTKRQEQKSSYKSINFSTGSGWWKVALVLLGIVIMLGFVISLVTGVIVMLAPVLFPIVLGMIVYQILKRRR